MTTVLVIERMRAARQAIEQACRSARLPVVSAADIEQHAYDAGLVAVASREPGSWSDAEALVRAGTPVVAMVDGRRPDADLDALRAGAVGTVARTGSPSTIVAAIQAAARGEAVLPVDVLEAIASLVPERTEQAVLAPDDQVVLEHLVAGSTVTEIAEALCVSERTAYHRLDHLYDALGVTSRAEAIAAGVDQGAVSP